MAHGVADPGLEQQQAHGYQVHRAHERFAHARRPVEPAAVVDRPPDRFQFGRRDYDGRVEHDRGRRVALLECRRIYERLEGRAGLPERLRGAVEFRGREVEAAHEAGDRGVFRIDRDQRALHLGHLRKRPETGARGHDIYDVARRQNLGCRLRRRAGGFAVDEWFRPADTAPRYRRRGAVAKYDVGGVVLVDLRDQCHGQAARRVLVEYFERFGGPLRDFQPRKFRRQLHGRDRAAVAATAGEFQKPVAQRVGGRFLQS